MRRVTIRELMEFAEAAAKAAGRKGLVPISPQRARAQATNPYADPDDVVLIVAYSGDACVGYFGILPGRLKTATGIHKVYWGTTWYVDPRHRGDGTALRLIQDARALNYDLVATDLTDTALRVFKGMGCVEFGPLSYFKMQLSRGLFPAPAIRVLASALRRLSRSAQGFDGLINRAAAWRSSFHRALLSRRLNQFTAAAFRRARYELTREPFAPGIVSGISWDTTETPCFQRDPDVIDWMLRYKWIIAEDEREAAEVPYAFSNVRKAFTFLWLSLFDRSTGQSLGAAILSLSQERRAVLKLLDSSPGVPPELLLASAVRAAAQVRADTLVLPHRVALPLTNARIRGLRLERAQRAYVCLSATPSGPVSEAIPRLVLNYCDGDSAFV